jgi:hypothetical protein
MLAERLIVIMSNISRIDLFEQRAQLGVIALAKLGALACAS